MAETNICKKNKESSQPTSQSRSAPFSQQHKHQLSITFDFPKQLELHPGRVHRQPHRVHGNHPSVAADPQFGQREGEE
jgi:hypothetical protein